MIQTLTIERLRKLLNYDPNAGIFTWQTPISTKVKVGQIVGYENNRGYLRVRLDGRKFYLAHRLAWFYVHGVWPENQIDHRDGNRTNNAILNLRDVTNRVNAENRRVPRADSASGLLGAIKYGDRWKASICIRGKTRHIGVYDTPEHAHQAYVDEKRKRHIGCTL